MRNDLNESPQLAPRSGSRRERRGDCHDRSANVGLEPSAVDAALSDETMPMIAERGSRRDLTRQRESGVDSSKRLVDGPHRVAIVAAEDADGLLRSLAEQLDWLHRQQQEIRVLLDQAGRRRLDHAGR